MFVPTCGEQMFDKVSRGTYRARVWQDVAWVARETIYIKDIEIYEKNKLPYNKGSKEQMFMFYLWFLFLFRQFRQLYRQQQTIHKMGL